MNLIGPQASYYTIIERVDGEVVATQVRYAQVLGDSAAKLGLTRNANPYEIGSDDAIDWDDGYDSAKVRICFFDGWVG